MPRAAPESSSTPSVDDRIKQAREILGMSERALLRAVGLKSTSHLAVARARGGDVQWKTLEPIVRYLHSRGFSRDWVLFGVGEPVVTVRVGVDPGEPNPKPIRKKKRGE